jgi:hypothetical protein
MSGMSRPKTASFPAVDLVLEEVVADELLLVVGVLLGPVPDDHVVGALEGVARHLRLLAHDREVFLEGTLPHEIAVEVEVLHGGDPPDHAAVTDTLGHPGGSCGSVIEEARGSRTR